MRWNSRLPVRAWLALCIAASLGISGARPARSAVQEKDNQSPPQPVQNNKQTPPAGESGSSPPATLSGQQTATAGMQPHGSGFLVIVDAAHGGDDRGAVLGDNFSEKDLTLAVARRLRADLQEHGIPARLLRDSDVSLSFDQRVEIANEQKASVYVAVHAGSPGEGVRVYSAALDGASAPAPGRFLPWERAQSSHLQRSRGLARAVVTELTRKNVTAAGLSAPLRPLNSISASAIAIELAADDGETQRLASPKFQASVAAGVAAAIAQYRGQLERQP